MTEGERSRVVRGLAVVLDGNCHGGDGDDGDDGVTEPQERRILQEPGKDWML